MPRRKQDRPKRMKWEDGEQNKEKGLDGACGPDSVAGDDGPSSQLEGSVSSQSSSRSGTPELPQIEEGSRSMDLVNKSALPMDISATFLPNPDLAQEEEEEEDAEEEGDPSAPNIADEDGPLDFSLKRSTEEESVDETDEDISRTPNGLPPTISQDGPLDLSVPRRRRDCSDGPRQAKMAKLETTLSLPSSPWGYSTPKHLSKGSHKHSPDVPVWNGKLKPERREKVLSSAVAKAVLNRSTVYHPLLHKNSSPPLDKVSESRKASAGGSKTDPYRPAGRQNPWQSQWMSRSSEQTKDVFTCVWCKESFRSLADMTVHMKQSPRCGMAGMQTSIPVTPPTSSSSSAGTHPPPHQSPLPSKCSTSSTSSGGSAANAVIKENVSLPRKLVRGQDVWLGKGAEQTRQILKCMWCGQSFKSLADMTTHMRVTQHYTNIISQEQIISWRTPEDKMAAQSQVNAVLTCKVCDQAFGSLKELSYHMVKNSHYKEHILRSITEGGGRRRQTRERRKKSLPVRKLLELERMELNKQGQGNPNDLSNQAKNEVVDGKISCEECTEKVDAKDFVQHIKNCAQGSRSQQAVKSSPGSESAKSGCASGELNLDVAATSGVVVSAPSSTSPVASQDTQQEEGKNPSGQVIQQDDSMCDSTESAGSTSVLNAIERLIEKSFESKGRRNAVSTGILQRLGIDEEVYPPWHPSSSPNAFGALRSPSEMQGKSTSPLGRVHDFKVDMADFSGSESRSRSSSTSEKHPSFDDHLRLAFGLTKDVMNRVSTPSSASQSCSPVNFQPESPADDRSVFSKENIVAVSAAITAASATMTTSPRRRSATPLSDRDLSERNSAKDEDYHRENKEPEEVAVEATDRCDSDDGHPIDCSGRGTPRSDDRQTPVSGSSSCEPESAATSAKLSKSMLRKKRNASSSEGHRSSVSSNKRRSPHSPRRKNSDLASDTGGESAVGSPLSTHSADVTSPPQKTSETAAGDHPLKELQKLLDKTDAHLSRPSLPATPGSILAFSWACSEATTSDSLMKCAFCDTHFISKGAYRHHLSKMHFVKDGNLAEIASAASWKPQSTSGKGSTTINSSNGSGGGSGEGNGGGSDAGNQVTSSKDPPASAITEESPHSKFLKYTELAKQLSSKYV